MKVSAIDEDGSLRLSPTSLEPADVAQRIPIEASYLDVDGVRVHVLVHVVDGYLNELEIFREAPGEVLLSPIEAVDLEIEDWYSD